MTTKMSGLLQYQKRQLLQFLPLLCRRGNAAVAKEVPNNVAAQNKKPKKARKFESPVEVSDSLCLEDIFTEDHVELRRNLRKIIEKDINPYCDEWEKAQMFPAHKILKILGDAGFLGVNKPVEYGGLGLDFSYNIAIAEELGKKVDIKITLASSKVVLYLD